MGMRKPVVEWRLGLWVVCGLFLLLGVITPADAQQRALSSDATLLIAGGADDMSTGPTAAKGDGGSTPREQWPEGKSPSEMGESGAALAGGEAGMNMSAEETEPHGPLAGFFGAETKTVPVTYRQLFETAGFLAHDVESVGEIIDGEPSNQISFAPNDIVFINRGSKDGVSKGDRFLTFHLDSREIYHPVDRERHWYGDRPVSLGRRVVVDGVLEVLDVQDNISRVEIIRSYFGIGRGGLIMPYEAKDIPAYDPDQPPADKKLAGYIVGGKEMRNGYASGDVVYLDKGASDGVEPGDVFSIIDETKVAWRDGKYVTGMPKEVGSLRIIGVTDSGATGYIFRSSESAKIGKRVVYAKYR